MKILKHGNVPEYTFMCSRCGCEFIASINECEVSEYPNLSITGYITAECPDCHKKIVDRLKE